MKKVKLLNTSYVQNQWETYLQPLADKVHPCSKYSRSRFSLGLFILVVLKNGYTRTKYYI